MQRTDSNNANDLIVCKHINLNLRSVPYFSFPATHLTQNIYETNYTSIFTYHSNSGPVALRPEFLTLILCVSQKCGIHEC